MSPGARSERRFLPTKSHVATAPAINPSPPIDTPTPTPIVVLLLEDDGGLGTVAADSVFPAEADVEVDAWVDDPGGAVLAVVAGVEREEVAVEVEEEATRPTVVNGEGFANSKNIVSKTGFGREDILKSE